MKRMTVEVCCGSADDVIEAWKAGADRVELNSDLFHGGLTPTVGSLCVAKRETELPVMTMIRPREGGFCYTEAEFAVCLEDARVLLENGADGLVFGFLHPDGTIDRERTRVLTDIARAAGKDAVFHRAIDVVPDWRAALDTLIELGVTRVLTSGLAPDVSWGGAVVREMLAHAAGRIQILPGAGITPLSLERVLEETGADQIHVAIHRTLPDPSTVNNRAIFYGGCLYPPEDRFSLLDRDAVGALVKRAKG